VQTHNTENHPLLHELQLQMPSDGIKVFTLPKTVNGDVLGGSFTFRYIDAAWIAAFDGNASNVIISQDGDVYKGSITAANLVNTLQGEIGPAGGGTFVVVFYTGTGPFVGTINHAFTLVPAFALVVNAFQWDGTDYIKVSPDVIPKANGDDLEIENILNTDLFVAIRA